MERGKEKDEEETFAKASAAIIMKWGREKETKNRFLRL